MKIIKNLNLFYRAARGYSLPMSVFSWSVPFIFGTVDGGKISYGILALIGILFAHLGVNLFDDFADFLIAKRKVKSQSDYSKILQKGKCSYLFDGSLTILQLLLLIIVCFTLALIIGVFLTLKTGIIVVYVMLTTAILGCLYPFLTYIALGEITVGIIFAPLLYIGVYYVMTKSFSFELLPLAFSTGLLTVGLLHAHMFFDYDFDKKNNKITLCSLAKSKQNAVNNQALIMYIAYANIVLFSSLGLIFEKILSPIYLLTILSIPTATVLLKLMEKDVLGQETEIKPNILYGYLGNLDLYEKIGNKNFMIKFLVARNVMVEFTFLLCIAKIISETIK